MQFTQDALFPDTDVVGTGRPHPWPAPEVEPQQTVTVQAERLPFDEDGDAR